MSAVSVILPVRDGGAWLYPALLSVLRNETVEQLVVVDDGSTDGAVEDAVRRAADPRVESVRIARSGIAAAANAGLARVRCELVGRMDADDESLPGRIDAQVRHWHELGRPDDTMVCCRVAPIGAEQPPGAGFVRYCRWQNSLLSREDHRRARFVESPLANPTVLAPTALLRRVGPWRDGPFPEDYELLLRHFAMGGSAVKMAEVGYRWRDHPRRFTHTDPRCTRARIMAVKLASMVQSWPELRARGAVQIIGGGTEAKLACDAFADNGVTVERVFDLHPRRIGGRLRGSIEVVHQRHFAEFADVPTVVAIVRKAGRAEIRSDLEALGRREGTHWYFVA